MIKTIIIPKDNHIDLIVPDNYIGKEIEILLYSKEEVTSEKSNKSMKDFWGKLSDTTSIDLQKQVVNGRDEWQKKFEN
ncbi:hypothetical protein A5893_05650 [Pedobacter psychrophilus]|uniref:Uncharacterized protein n=1 Tax=Pedobacter psychrophilus TaxID=1826909 RepID=A0A179DI08_9SPHI|nr:hypothetical protein [Pedobacter psychrophilus]OAQ40432.1 hypothetical protein A5893_05650 [Pedobacter psychrophilus]